MKRVIKTGNDAIISEKKEIKNGKTNNKKQKNNDFICNKLD